MKIVLFVSAMLMTVGEALSLTSGTELRNGEKELVDH